MGKGGGRKGFMKAAQARREEGEDEDAQASDTKTGQAPVVDDAPRVAKQGAKEQAAPGSCGDRAEEQDGVAKEETKGQMNQRHKRYVVAVEQLNRRGRSTLPTTTTTLTRTRTRTGIPTTAVRQRP